MPMDRGRPASLWARAADDRSWVTIQTPLTKAEVAAALARADGRAAHLELEVHGDRVRVLRTSEQRDAWSTDVEGQIEEDAKGTTLRLRHTGSALAVSGGGVPVQGLILAGVLLVATVLLLVLAGAISGAALSLLCFVPVVVPLVAVWSAVRSEPPPPLGGRSIQWVAAIVNAAEREEHGPPPPAPTRAPSAPYR